MCRRCARRPRATRFIRALRWVSFRYIRALRGHFRLPHHWHRCTSANHQALMAAAAANRLAGPRAHVHHWNTFADSIHLVRGKWAAEGAYLNFPQTCFNLLLAHTSSFRDSLQGRARVYLCCVCAAPSTPPFAQCPLHPLFTCTGVPCAPCTGLETPSTHCWTAQPIFAGPPWLHCAVCTPSHSYQYQCQWPAALAAERMLAQDVGMQLGDQLWMHADP